MPDPSARPIWSKRSTTPTNKAAQRRALAYCAGRDVAPRPAADAELIPYDLWTNRAHCLMLERKGIISPAAHQAIVRGLDAIEEQWRAGSFALDPLLEDAHMNIERAMVKQVGEEAAGMMHTARSRNDQSATDMRLWLRERLLGRLEAVSATIEALSRLGERHAATIAPGWTHGQPAMPTTLGHWATAHGWALARDGAALKALWPMINLCPLGAAAAFGTSWPIDRRLTARLLGFDGPQPSSLDAISTRWEAEARLGATLAIMMTHLSSLGQDLIFLSSPPRQALRLADAHVTGSSIMPNKRNPDFAEVTRARALAVHALAGNLMGVGRGALSGYNRDTQWTKYWIMDLVEEVGEAPELFAEVLGALLVDTAALSRMAAEGFSLAADLADHLARTRQFAFRRAYHVIAEAVAHDEHEGWFRLETLNGILRREKIEPPLDALELAAAGDPAQVLKKRRSLGGPALDQVRTQARQLRAKSASLRRWAREKKGKLEAARRKTWEQSHLTV